MSSTGIVLIGVPVLMRDIVRTLIAEDDALRIVGEFDDSDAALAVEDVDVDVVVTLATPELAFEAEALLRQWPTARVVALAADGRRSSSFELILSERVTGEITLDRLLAELHGPDGTRA